MFDPSSTDSAASDMYTSCSTETEFHHEECYYSHPHPSTSDNTNLFCYDTKENITQCRSLGQSGSCLISYEIKGNLINGSCITETTPRRIFGSISQSNKHATFRVECKQSLYNNSATLDAIKELMLKYNVTATLDGQLIDKEFIVDYGSKLMASISLVIFSLILNYHSNTI